MRLQLSTWPEVEDYLRKSNGVLVPIGATEQHGPVGIIGTDAICAETLAWGVGDQVKAMVAPTISVGMSEHHMAFPGSLTLRPSTLLLVVRDTVLALARHGFRRFFFLNGHGGNTPTVQAAFSEIYGEVAGLALDPPDLRCHIVQWWECSSAQRLGGELFGERDGDHATASEVSLASYAYPDRAPSGDLPPPAPSSAIYGCRDFRRRYPDGRMGSDPTLARVEHGETIYRAVVEELARHYLDFLTED